MLDLDGILLISVLLEQKGIHQRRKGKPDRAADREGGREPEEVSPLPPGIDGSLLS